MSLSSNNARTRLEVELERLLARIGYWLFFWRPEPLLVSSRSGLAAGTTYRKATDSNPTFYIGAGGCCLLGAAVTAMLSRALLDRRTV